MSLGDRELTPEFSQRWGSFSEVTARTVPKAPDTGTWSRRTLGEGWRHACISVVAAWTSQVWEQTAMEVCVPSAGRFPSQETRQRMELGGQGADTCGQTQSQVLGGRGCW